MILAGGFGTRLRPAVADVPKPLAPVAGRPFLEIILDDLVRQGVDLVVLCVGYRHEMIHEAIGDRHGPIRVLYSQEDTPLGTGGAIWQALAVCTADDVLVMNGDSYVEADLGQLMATHRAFGGPVTICTATVDDGARYGSVKIEDGRVIAFAEKGRAGPTEINAGVYVLRKDVANSFSMPAAFSFEQAFLAAHLDTLRPVAFRTHGAFIDIGVPADYEKAQSMFAPGG